MAIAERVLEPSSEMTNGAALASFLGAGIGAFAMGAIVIVGEVGVFTAPSLYAPAGGVSGRTTLAVVVWLAAWAVLHARWTHRRIEPWPVFVATILFIALGLLGTFPPFWGLL